MSYLLRCDFLSASYSHPSFNPDIFLKNLFSEPTNAQSRFKNDFSRPILDSSWKTLVFGVVLWQGDGDLVNLFAFTMSLRWDDLDQWRYQDFFPEGVGWGRSPPPLGTPMTSIINKQRPRKTHVWCCSSGMNDACDLVWVRLVLSTSSIRNRIRFWNCGLVTNMHWSYFHVRLRRERLTFSRTGSWTLVSDGMWIMSPAHNRYYSRTVTADFWL